jgi:hypothetical protein
VKLSREGKDMAGEAEAQGKILVLGQAADMYTSFLNKCSADMQDVFARVSDFEYQDKLTLDIKNAYLARLKALADDVQNEISFWEKVE